MNTVISIKDVVRLRARGPGYSIHEDSPSVFSVAISDHGAETIVIQHENIDWDQTDEQILEYINSLSP